MAEAPAASFRPEVSNKPTGLRERIQSKGRSLEAKRSQREAKARKRELRAPIPKTTVDALQAGRKKNGLGLNIQEDTRFKTMVQEQEDKMLRNSSLAKELGSGKLGPSQKAEAFDLAYAKFSTDHPDTAEKYARDGIHLVGPDKKGNYRVDVAADPFWRATQEQARVLRAQGNIDGAKQIIVDFATKYPTKAELYGANGARELEEVGGRDRSRTPDANVSATSVPATYDVGRTVSFTEQAQVTKSELDRMSALAKTDPNSLRAKDLNELKSLQLKHAQGITEARRLDTKLRIPNGPPLKPEELAALEPYEDYLNAQNADKSIATQQAVATGTPTAPDAQAKADQAKLEQAVRTQGAQIIGELKARGVDISTMSEKVAIERLRDKLITNPDGSTWQDDANTREYIHHAYVEQQKQLAEAVVANISQDQIDALVPGKKLTGADLLQLIAMLIATGAFATGKDAIASTKTS